ncbi:MAG: patatin-like phospholipase family protein [Parachlamydiaceae bacterium]|nr:patatin-like phospholipase family protein [Parachlamydiaceae bacterium]
MSLEQTKKNEGVSTGAKPTFPRVCPEVELETVGNVNRLMSKRDWFFWSGSTAGGIGFTSAMLGVVTVNPILILVGGVTLVAGSISMIGAALFHCFSKKNSQKILDSIPILNNADTVKELEKLNLSSPQVAPQPFFAEDGTVKLLRTTPPVRNLVLQGGGVKGLSYLSFIETLDEKCDIIRNLREVSGTSAGAIMGFLLASGVPFPVLKEYLENLNMLDQLGGESTRDLKQGFGIFSANKLTQHLCEKTSRSASDYLIENPNALEELAKDSVHEDFVERAKNGFKNGLKFIDLAILHRLDPEKFKLLHVTGYNKTTSTTEYYDLENCPDMYCNDAVRISMAIPLVIKSILVDGYEKTDGAQGDNAPIAPFLRKQGHKPAETLVLVFERNGAAARILHGPPGSSVRSLVEKILAATVRKVKSVVNTIIRAISMIFGGPKVEVAKDIENDESKPFYGDMPSRFKRIFLGENYVQDKKKEQANIHFIGPNVLIVPHGSLETTSFKASKASIGTAKAQAHAAARVYAEIRKNNGFYNSYETVNSAMESLTDDEKESISKLIIDESWPTAEKDFYAGVRNAAVGTAQAQTT